MLRLAVPVLAEEMLTILVGYTDWDSYQLSWIDFMYMWEQDRTKQWVRLDEQFSRNYKFGDWNRVVSWMGLFKERESCPKVGEYFGKLNIANGVLWPKKVYQLQRP